MPRLRAHGRPRAVLLAAVAVAAGLWLPSSSSGTSQLAASHTVRSNQRIDARVTLGRGRSVMVPRSFLGISAEYWTVPIWGGEPTLLRRVFSLLSTHGPVRLRIGGDSADRAQWSPTKELPEWVFELTPAWLRRARQIVRVTGAGLILDLNTMSSTPRLAARWARTATAGLPRGSIRAFEIGNEPDVYNLGAWRHMTAGPGAPPLPARISAAGYARSFAAYARAVEHVAPGVPLLAPALAEPQKNSDWITRLLAAPHPNLAGVTAHRYPYSACARHSAPTYPSIGRVLSEDATAGMGRTAVRLERLTDRARLPIWMTEINSVTCGGVRGVSNTFATALWAPDALFELVRSGVEAAFVHVRPPLVNMAFSLTRRGLTAYPLLYGLATFARMLGPGARLLPLHLKAAAALQLKAWAVQVNGGVMHVLLIDKGARAVHVRLELPGHRGATIQRLTAPTIASSTGVTLNGQHLTSAASWTGAPGHRRLFRGRHGFIAFLPRHSVALITLSTGRR